MEHKLFPAYLSLLRDLTNTLDSLTEVAHQKVQAVRNDDLAALDICMKEEQALSMTLRSYDQKRTVFLAQLGLSGLPLSSLPAHTPDEYYTEAKQVVEQLRRQYELFGGASEAARNTLECNLHQIEKFLAESSAGSGVESQDIPSSPRRKTDFKV